MLRLASLKELGYAIDLLSGPRTRDVRLGSMTRTPSRHSEVESVETDVQELGRALRCRRLRRLKYASGRGWEGYGGPGGRRG